MLQICMQVLYKFAITNLLNMYAYLALICIIYALQFHICIQILYKFVSKKFGIIYCANLYHAHYYLYKFIYKSCTKYCATFSPIFLIQICYKFERKSCKNLYTNILHNYLQICKLILHQLVSHKLTNLNLIHIFLLYKCLQFLCKFLYKFFKLVGNLV